MDKISAYIPLPCWVPIPEKSFPVAIHRSWLKKDMLIPLQQLYGSAVIQSSFLHITTPIPIVSDFYIYPTGRSFLTLTICFTQTFHNVWNVADWHHDMYITANSILKKARSVTRYTGIINVCRMMPIYIVFHCDEDDPHAVLYPDPLSLNDDNPMIRSQLLTVSRTPAPLDIRVLSALKRSTGPEEYWLMKYWPSLDQVKQFERLLNGQAVLPERAQLIMESQELYAIGKNTQSIITAFLALERTTSIMLQNRIAQLHDISITAAGRWVKNRSFLNRFCSGFVKCNLPPLDEYNPELFETIRRVYQMRNKAVHYAQTFSDAATKKAMKDINESIHCLGAILKYPVSDIVPPAESVAEHKQIPTMKLFGSA